MNGILNVYKPGGMSSHAVVSRIRKFTDTKRVGHAGTLDPMACGVLPVLVGNAAGVQALVMEHDKVYRAGIRFGLVTDTGDVTGNVLRQSEPAFSAERLDGVLAGFLGTQEQIPPMYSAIKHNGVKLYDLARKGVEVERKARTVTFYRIGVVTPFDGARCEIEVACSKGTYIRTLAQDIGERLGCGACLDSLERTVCGDYKAEDAVMLDTLEALYANGDTDAIGALLISPETLFLELPRITLPPFFERLSRNGAEVYLTKARLSPSLFDGTGLCRLYGKDCGFYAVGELADYPDGKAIRIRYRFT